jgi:hypothetical protein
MSTSDLMPKAQVDRATVEHSENPAKLASAAPAYPLVSHRRTFNVILLPARSGFDIDQKLVQCCSV